MFAQFQRRSRCTVAQSIRGWLAAALVAGLWAGLSTPAGAQARGAQDVTVPAQRGQFDYTNTIQTLINRAGLGGTVRFQPGVYFLTGVSLLDGQHIVIPSGAVLTRLPNAPPFVPMLSAYHLSGVVIDGGGGLDGNKYAHARDSRTTAIYFRGCDSCAVRNLRITNIPSSRPSGSYGDGVTVGDTGLSTNLVFENLWITGCERHGIFLGNARGVQIRNCRMMNISGDPGSAINLEPDVAEQDVNDVLIENNVIAFCVHGLTANNGYQRDDRDFTGIQVLNNAFYSNKCYGLYAGDWGPGSVVSGNSFDGNGGVGVYMRSRFGARIENNWIARNGSNGLSLVESQYFSVSGNNFISNGGHGCEISKNSPSNAPYYGTVRLNEFWNNGQRAAGERDGLRIVGLNPFNLTQVDVWLCDFGNATKWGASTQRFGLNLVGDVTPAEAAAVMAVNQFQGNLRQ